MTVLIGFKGIDSVYLAADGLSSTGYRIDSKNSGKILLVSEDVMIASCGNTDAKSFLGYLIQESGLDFDEERHQLMYEYLPKKLSEYKNWCVDNIYLVVIQGTLWRVSIDSTDHKPSYMASEITDTWVCEGSGWSEAANYLRMNERRLSAISIPELLKGAITFAGENNLGCNTNVTVAHQLLEQKQVITSNYISKIL